MDTQVRGDYQQFDIMGGRLLNVEGRMLQKMEALESVLPNWEGKTVLDIGCDFGYWSFLAAAEGATVLGLDRGREVKGHGWVNLPARNNAVAREEGLDAAFLHYEAGVEWSEDTHYDIVLVMSVYHHIYQNTGGDHESIWYWLRRGGGNVVFEGPTEADDRVVQMNVHPSLHAGYGHIRQYAERYFDIVYEGPAIHEDTRTVWLMEPKPVEGKTYRGMGQSGAGGAKHAFMYAENRRIQEIENTLGIEAIPGSFNVFLDEPFEWDTGYYRARMLDVRDRSLGLDSEWGLRPVRFYPVLCNGTPAYVMRFEGETYPLNMIELISDELLNTTEQVEIDRWQ